jgi:hypothetical protein
MKFEAVPAPTARQVSRISSQNGTFVLATTFRFSAPVSNTTIVPLGPMRTSNRAVPGVVTAHEMRPARVIFSMSFDAEEVVRQDDPRRRRDAGRRRGGGQSGHRHRPMRQLTPGLCAGAHQSSVMTRAFAAI